MVMSTRSQSGDSGIEVASWGPSEDSIRAKDDPELAHVFQEREAEIQPILSRRKPELIRQGIEAYKRDLPQLLAENRCRQMVAYRGSEMVATGATERQLRK